MKIFTDLEQSKKLAEILSIESADMWWAERYAGRVEGYEYIVEEKPFYYLCYEYIVEEKPFYYLSFTKPSVGNYSQDTIKDIPCWSLSALLDVLPEGIIENYYVPNLQKENGKYSIAYGNEELLCVADNPIDACVEMIVKLKNMNFL